MASPAVATTTRGAVQGARSAVRETGRIARESLGTPRSSARMEQQKAAGKGSQSPTQNTSTATPMSQMSAQPVSRAAQRPPSMPSGVRGTHQGVSVRQTVVKNSASGGMNIRGNTGGSSAVESGIASASSIGDQLKSKGLSSLCFTLPVAIVTFDLLNSTWMLFALWTNFIGWNLFPVARPLLARPGGELIFFAPEWREIMHAILLLLFTFIYLMELGLLLVILILIISFVQDIINAFPPPLNTFFKF